LIHPVMTETGIMAIQNSVNQPFVRRMNTGSPLTDAHNVFMTCMAGSVTPRAPVSCVDHVTHLTGQSD
jgi:hypothetical protein